MTFSSLYIIKWKASPQVPIFRIHVLSVFFLLGHIIIISVVLHCLEVISLLEVKSVTVFLCVSKGLNKNQTQTERDTRKFLEVMELFMNLTVVVVTWVYTYVYTHQIVPIVYINRVGFFIYQLYLSEARGKE